MARPRLTDLPEKDRACVHEQAGACAGEPPRTHEVELLAEDVAAETDAVIGRHVRSVDAPVGRVSWRGAL